MLTGMCCTWVRGRHDRDIQRWPNLVEMKITRHMLSTLKAVVYTVPCSLLLLLFFLVGGRFLQILPPCPHIALSGRRANCRKILQIYSMVKIMSLMIRSHVLSQRGAFGGVFLEYSAGSDPPCLCPSISNSKSPHQSQASSEEKDREQPP